MFRRALAKFCLPCGGETEVDNVSDFDPDTEYFRPKDFHAVQARVRAERYTELMSQWEAYFRKLHAPPPSDYRWVKASHWLWAASLKDLQHQGRVSQQVPAGPESRSGEQLPAAASGPRGCIKCWQKRAGVGPRRYDKMGFPLPQIPPE